MVAVEPGLRDIVEHDVDLLPLLQRVARRPPEKPLSMERTTTALAAIECVAAAAGRPPAEPPELLLRWLAAHPAGPSAPLMAAAIKALDRLRGTLADAALDDLRARLHGR